MATNSKHRKKHKQKVQARRTRMQEEKKRHQKAQREFIMNLIKEEQAKGAFEGTQTFPTTETDNTSVVIEGPSI